MKFLHANAPALPPDRVRRIAAERFGLRGTAKTLYSERDQNTLLREADGRAWMLKVANIDEDPAAIDCQIQVLRHIQRVDPDVPVPRVLQTLDGQTTARIEAADGRSHVVYALSYVDGRIAAEQELSPGLLRRVGAMQARLGRAMRGFFHPAAGSRELLWDVRMAASYLPHLALLPGDQRDIAARVLDEGINVVLPKLAGLRAQAIHGDLHAHNLILDAAGDIAGIIDFGDMIHGPLIADLAAAISDFAAAPGRLPTVLESLVAGYHPVTPLEPDERALLFDLVELRLVFTMLVNAYRRIRTPEEPNYAADAGFGGWESLGALHRLTREGFMRHLEAACGLRASGGPAPADAVDLLLARRKRLLGSRPYLFYDRPIHAVRGEGVWIVDDAGRRYLDCYNNVPIVGHCHPHVTEAIARQGRILNTNTRYLGEQVLDYAERLGAKCGGLTACAFVNSGSEANDIAWRMATAWTGAHGVLAQEFAYHGITEAIDAISPSAIRIGKLAAHVRTLLAPDGYRGIHRAGTPDLGLRYAEDVDQAVASLAAAGLKPAAYFVDSAFMTNGILEPQPGYVAEVFRRVRAAGGLCIADEVQSGFGRMGGHFWGYQHHGVTPDIITIGKPAGNGHPVGVVLTRPEILDHFVDRTAFFSTFGGNNVSAAAGLAVLDVLENEDLTANATAVGAYFRAGLESLKVRYPIIGDVRSIGLAIGVELVRDPATREPAPQETMRLINGLRDEGVLVGSEGVHGNIIKMRPPLVFRRDHVDVAITAFRRALATLGHWR
jgi:4-aminobutyrate aminotransferase-like enzyme/Ser/Thr protein kinase RdoA (MazF antagonist)